MAELQRLGDLDSTADDGVTVDPSAAEILVEDALIDLGVTLRFPARAQVTRLYLPRGLTVTGDPDAPCLTLPRGIGWLSSNETPERAFATAFALGSEANLNVMGPARDRLALSVSLGADQLNGPWWSLGAMAGMTRGESLAGAWASHAPLLGQPGEMRGALEVAARSLRLQTGIEAHPMSQSASRAIRAQLPSIPPADVWREFIRDCETLGAGDVAAPYIRLYKRLWPLDA